jgi:hypothetical protein
MMFQTDVQKSAGDPRGVVCCDLDAVLTLCNPVHELLCFIEYRGDIFSQRWWLV